MYERAAAQSLFRYTCDRIPKKVLIAVKNYIDIALKPTNIIGARVYLPDGRLIYFDLDAGVRIFGSITSERIKNCHSSYPFLTFYNYYIIKIFLCQIKTAPQRGAVG
jgi:hypothetical protein